MHVPAGFTAEQLRGMTIAGSLEAARSVTLEGWPRDRDGLLVPPDHWPNANWQNLPLVVRKKLAWTEEQIRGQKAPKSHKARTPATRFTTGAAIKYGQAMGWKLVERETYDYRTKRHHDVRYGMDAIMRDLDGFLVGVQGAGVGERAEHFERFLARTRNAAGVIFPETEHMRFFYWEFKRGQFEPVKFEQWRPDGKVYA